MRPHRRQPTRLHRPWDSPSKNTGVGCYFLLQCMQVKSEREVSQSCPTLSDPMDCSLPGSSVHGIFQARVLEWGAIAFSEEEGCSKLVLNTGYLNSFRSINGLQGIHKHLEITRKIVCAWVCFCIHIHFSKKTNNFHYNLKGLITLKVP